MLVVATKAEKWEILYQTRSNALVIEDQLQFNLNPSLDSRIEDKFNYLQIVLAIEILLNLSDCFQSSVKDYAYSSSFTSNSQWNILIPEQ